MYKVEEAVPPKYYDKLATQILRKGMKIYFYSFARMEKAFTKDVLQNLYNAGAKWVREYRLKYKKRNF